MGVSEERNTPDDLPESGGIGGLLSQPNRVQEDCHLIRRAIAEGWPVPMERRQRILTTLQQIVETDTFEIERVELTKSGEGQLVREETTAKVKAPNHKNQIAAARTILDAYKTDQSDKHHVEDHNKDERHHQDNREQRERHHAIDAARGAHEPGSVQVGIAVGRPLTDADRIRIAVENNVVHLLPPELAEQARKALP